MVTKLQTFLFANYQEVQTKCFSKACTLSSTCRRRAYTNATSV